MSWRDVARAASLLIPAWWVWNPGQGGGGGGTVHTDGVTIKGDGSVGTPIAIKQVEHDATLTGAGTVASPLSAPGVTQTFFAAAPLDDATPLPGANAVWVTGIEIPYPLTFSDLTCWTGAPGGDTNDVGIYSAAGNLIAHTGPILNFQGAPGTFPLIGGPLTIPAGLYLLAFTGDGNNLFMLYKRTAWAWFSDNNYATSSGGTLPATIPPPAVSVNQTVLGFVLS